MKSNMEEMDAVSKTRKECDECGKSFKDKHSLKSHIHRAHLAPELRKAVCDLCGKLFKHKGNVKEHKTLVHGASEAVECEVCKKVFNNQRYLNSHMRIHTNPESLKRKCEMCDKMIFKGNLKMHVKSVHLEEETTEIVECNICNAKIKRYNEIRDIVSNHFL